MGDKNAPEKVEAVLAFMGWTMAPPTPATAQRVLARRIMEADHYAALASSQGDALVSQCFSEVAVYLRGAPVWTEAEGWGSY